MLSLGKRANYLVRGYLATMQIGYRLYENSFILSPSIITLVYIHFCRKLTSWLRVFWQKKFKLNELLYFLTVLIIWCKIQLLLIIGHVFIFPERKSKRIGWKHWYWLNYYRHNYSHHYTHNLRKKNQHRLFTET